MGHLAFATTIQVHAVAENRPWIICKQMGMAMVQKDALETYRGLDLVHGPVSTPETGTSHEHMLMLCQHGAFKAASHQITLETILKPSS